MGSFGPAGSFETFGRAPWRGRATAPRRPAEPRSTQESGRHNRKTGPQRAIQSFSSGGAACSQYQSTTAGRNPPQPTGHGEAIKPSIQRMDQPIHPLTYLPIDLFTTRPVHRLPQILQFTHSPTHPLTHSPIHPFTHSPIHPFTHSPSLPHSPPPILYDSASAGRRHTGSSAWLPEAGAPFKPSSSHSPSTSVSSRTA